MKYDKKNIKNLGERGAKKSQDNRFVEFISTKNRILKILVPDYLVQVPPTVHHPWFLEMTIMEPRLSGEVWLASH
jgi:hypothetical protein